MIGKFTSANIGVIFETEIIVFAIDDEVFLKRRMKRNNAEL
jgi:hypothetical protein